MRQKTVLGPTLFLIRQLYIRFVKVYQANIKFVAGWAVL
jgi:hypothetical protein